MTSSSKTIGMPIGTPASTKKRSHAVKVGAGVPIGAISGALI